jgi:hypothetical protein
MAFVSGVRFLSFAYFILSPASTPTPIDRLTDNTQSHTSSTLVAGAMSYTWTIKPIRFNGLAVPQLNSGHKARTLNFENKDTFDAWYKGLVAGLAELDEAMNYCKYFVREKGNAGHYVREGKSFPVDGSWIGNQDFDNYPPCQPFVAWLTENGWRDTWFDLMDRYKEHIAAAPLIDYTNS